MISNAYALLLDGHVLCKRFQFSVSIQQNRYFSTNKLFIDPDSCYFIFFFYSNSTRVFRVLLIIFRIDAIFM